MARWRARHTIGIGPGRAVLRRLNEDKSMNTISNQEDVIDSRDVIARIEELEREREEAMEADEERAEELREERRLFDGEPVLEGESVNDACREYEWAQAYPDDAAELAQIEELTDDGTPRVLWDASADGEELKTLKTLADQCEGYGDWRHGETLIRESYFRDYAMQLADDLGAVPDNVGWPLTCIDWERAARELQMGYTEVDYDGVSYFIRA